MTIIVKELPVDILARIYDSEDPSIHQEANMNDGVQPFFVVPSYHEIAVSLQGSVLIIAFGSFRSSWFLLLTVV